LNLDEYQELRSSQQHYRDRFVCLTFDDGYLDNYVFVYPALKELGAKGTVFVNPTMVQDGTEPRQFMEYSSNPTAAVDDLDFLGYCNWPELRIMDSSGVIDVQSHTMTHTKIFCSDKLIDFHNPGAKWLYPICNLYPSAAPYYAQDPDFEHKIPYGTPFFEEKSSIVAQKVIINENFINEAVGLLSSTDWQNYAFEACWHKVKPLYDDYRGSSWLISSRESEAEYQKRVEYEIVESKRVIEAKLNKTVRHICWPHGDYTDFCHRTAMQAGYSSSLYVGRDGKPNFSLEKFERIGAGNYKNSLLLSNAKLLYQIQAQRGVFPFSQVKWWYRFLKYGIK